MSILIEVDLLSMKNEKAYLKQVLNNSMEEDVFYQRTEKKHKFSKNKKSTTKKVNLTKDSFDDDWGTGYRDRKK